MLNIFRSLFIIILSLTAPALAAPGNESDDIRVTLTRTPVQDNGDIIDFIGTCIDNDPGYYRFTTLPQIQEVLTAIVPSREQKIMKARLCAMDTLDTFMGWYLIHETKPNEETQVAGLLTLDSNTETSLAEASLIYLPRDMLWNQKGLTSQVLNLAQELVKPHQGQLIQFLQSIDQRTFRPVYEYKKLMGICSSIYSHNYASLICAYRSGFRVFALTSKGFTGHEYILSNPPYDPIEGVAEIDAYLAGNSGMRELAASANQALALLEDTETRTYGKLYLWHIHCSYSGIYTVAQWTAGIGITMAAVWYGYS
jgi:hypothetical protein